MPVTWLSGTANKLEQTTTEELETVPAAGTKPRTSVL